MIKKVEKENLKEVLEVIKKSFLTVAKEFNITFENAPFYVAYSMSLEKLLGQFNEGRPMYAYFKDGKIVGYYSLCEEGNDKIELNNLCVLDDCRHQGIGDELLKHAFMISKEKKMKIMDISIVEENKTLKKWYGLYGFKHVENKKFPFFPFTCGYMKKDLEE